MDEVSFEGKVLNFENVSLQRPGQPREQLLSARPQSPLAGAGTDWFAVEMQLFEGRCLTTLHLTFHSPDIPVFPTITATVTFQEFRCDEFDGSIFAIPEDYKEDPSRFPDL